MAKEANPSQPGALSPQPILNPKCQPGEPPSFSHPAEEAFARVLDFYETQWEYEPMTFPLEWDREGRVTNAFSPDFYLVEEDLYIELTTMKQSLVTKKNRKLRLLRQLYPDVKCKLVYRRDVENMAVKFGLFEDLPSSDEDEDDLTPTGQGQDRPTPALGHLEGDERTAKPTIVPEEQSPRENKP